MIQTEKQILKEIMSLLGELDKATYGEYKANDHFLPPSASRFYHTTRRLYENVDTLVNNYSPTYITHNDYSYIYDSPRLYLLDLNVLRYKKLEAQELTWELEKYLIKLHGVFQCVSEYCKTQNCKT